MKDSGIYYAGMQQKKRPKAEKKSPVQEDAKFGAMDGKRPCDGVAFSTKSYLSWLCTVRDVIY